MSIILLVIFGCYFNYIHSFYYSYKMSISRRGTITSYTAPLDIDIVDKYTDVLCAGYDDAIYPNACIDRITLYNIAINFHKMKLLLFLQDANVSDNDKINAVYMHNKQTLSIYARNITAGGLYEYWMDL